VLRGTVLTGTGGRLRLGWRLLFFLVIATLVWMIVGMLLPAGIQSGSAALLLGALSGGWATLALDGRPPGALGFYSNPLAGREAVLGLALGVAVAMVVVFAIAVFGGLRWSAQTGTAGAWVVGSASSMLFLALPAAAEEALLRGYPLQALAEAWGPSAALLVTSITFGAVHFGNPEVTGLGLANIAAAGLLLGAVYLRTGSLWWSTGVHLGWNWGHGYLADVPVSGLEILDAPFYDGVAQGPNWLSGGGFGPEGSVLATVVVLAAAAACWWGPWLRPGAEALSKSPLAVMEPHPSSPEGATVS
jgi:membrane protease YdiL (CAAX protease family)